MSAAGPRADRDLGVGVVGVGDVSDIYLDNLPRFAGLRLVACAGGSRHQIAVAKAAARGIEALPPDVLLRRSDIDLVVNLTPPAVHGGVTRAALEAGKHVYSEKPLASTAAEARALLEEAGRRGLLIGCAPDTVLGAGPRLARALVDEGAIGRVLSGTCMFLSHGMEHRHPDPGFFFRKGAGPVFDMGPYYLSVLVHLLGPVGAVTARAATGFAERVVSAPGPSSGARIAVETPTHVSALLSFRSGAEITLMISWDVWKHGHPLFELYGSDGSMRLPNPDYFGGPVALAIGEGEWGERPSDALPYGQGNWRHRLWSPERTPIANYRGVGVAELAAALRDGTPHRTSGAFALHVVEAMEAILRAAEERSTIDLPESIARPPPMTEAEALSLLRPVARARS